MISLFKDEDVSVWVPVANGKGGGAARAFLPFNGRTGTYRYGYKASPSTGIYFDALRDIQQSFIDNEHQVFVVNSVKKKEKQHKARWRHGNKTGSPLLGPSMGWVRVPVDELEKLSESDLGKALQAAGAEFTQLSPATAEPVLCDSPESLERESARLFREASIALPSGQAAPARQERSAEQFVRDAVVVAYVLRQARGNCECCMKPAPFTKPNGLPYLEVHHVKRLASGGSDKISNAIAVCPNCHRELHLGANSDDIAYSLYTKVGRLVRE